MLYGISIAIHFHSVRDEIVYARLKTFNYNNHLYYICNYKTIENFTVFLHKKTVFHIIINCELIWQQLHYICSCF